MPEFKTDVRESSGVKVIDLNGYLDAHTAHHLEEAFSKLIEDQQYKVVVNFEKLKYISSAGLGVFMAFIETMRGNGGDIKLAEMQPNVFNIFDLLGFPMLYDILPNESDAIKKFSN